MEVGYRHVLALGVFDLFHIGHLRYLQYARGFGRRLTVAVLTDDACLLTKGRVPVVTQSQRLEIVRGLGWVNDVRLQPCSTESTPQAAQWIAEWGITHVVVGGGWLGSERWARMKPALAAKDITVSFAPHTPAISTSEIVEACQRRFPVHRSVEAVCHATDFGVITN